MGASQTGEDFLTLLQHSQLIEASMLDRLRSKLGDALAAGMTARKLAASLYGSKLITEYHARQLLAGRYKGFYIAKYKALELLGSGGMGKVYLCEQITMQRLVAVKVVRIRHKERRSEILSRFTREARAVAALRHPNIIHAYDFDEENGTPYIVMEYVEGIDTAHMVGKFGPVKWPQAAEMIRQAAAGLQHAHEAGLVHRDVKPGNLLVDVNGQIKLLDLGLCSALEADADDSLTVDQDQLGTVDFIAPEQALDSHNVDARADIYSLGATFYSLLTGNVLYPDKSTAQKLLLHQTEAPTPIRTLVPDVPEALAHVIDRMLQKKPADRYQTAIEVFTAIEPFAQPTSPPYALDVIKYPRSRIEPFMRRSPNPADISVATLGAGQDSDIRPKTTDSGRMRGTSRISVSSPEPESDDFSFSDDISRMELDSPSMNAPRAPRTGGVKRPGRSKKKQPSGIPQPLLIGGSVLAGLLLVVFLATVVFRGDAVSDVGQNTQPNVKGVAPPQEPVGSTYAAWKADADQTSAQPGLLLHHKFERPFGLDRKLHNSAAKNQQRFDLTVEQARWAQGRFPEKGALAFGGGSSGQHAWFNQKDSDRLDLHRPTTIAIWFKVDRFDVKDQALLTKGDHAWRIHRHRSMRVLSFEFNKPVLNANGKPIVRPGQKQSRVTLRGQTPVDDARWHLATLVVSIAKDDIGKGNVAKDGAAVEYLFYVDRKLEGKLVSVRPNKTPDRVWLGGNSHVQAPVVAQTQNDPNLSDGTRTWNGLVDEIAIWNRAIGQQKVRQLHRIGRPPE